MGVIHLATGAVDNALWDMYAKSRKKPLWELVDMTPVRPIVCSKGTSYLTLAPRRSSRRHYVPVRPHLPPPFRDIRYLIHVKVYNRRNHT